MILGYFNVLMNEGGSTCGGLTVEGGVRGLPRKRVRLVSNISVSTGASIIVIINTTVQS